MTFPICVFSALFYRHYGEMIYIIPFVLWYTFHRAGVFIISCFGTITNPYKICCLELLSACIGCFILLFKTEHLWLFSIGAILIGLGTSGYAAMFRTVRDKLQEIGLINFNGSVYAGYGIFLTAILISLYLGINNVKRMTYCLAFMVYGSFFFVVLLWPKVPYNDYCMFKKNKIQKQSLLYATSILISTFSLRLYRQTTTKWTLVVLLIAFALMLFGGTKYKQQPYRPHSMRTLWYGAITNYLYVFSLLSFTSSGDSKNLSLAYIMIGLGSTIAAPASKIINKVISPEKFETFCIISAILSSFLMPVPELYMAGISMTSMFISMGGIKSFQLYMSDERFEYEERRLTRSKFFSLGSIIEQIQLLVVITLFSELITKNCVTGIAGYAFKHQNEMNKQVYHLSLIASVILNAATGLLIILQHQCGQLKPPQQQ